MDYNLSPTVLLEYARLYKDWYIVAICVFSAIVIINQNKTNQKFNNIFSLIVGIIIIAFITFRPPVGIYFGDTANYIGAFENSIYRNYNSEAKDIGHEFLMYSLQSFSYLALFFVYALLYVGCQLLAVKRLFPNYVAVAFILIIGSLSFFGYGFNGMRNGAACALVMLAITERKLFIQIILSLIALSLHFSVILPILCYVVVRVYKNTSIYMTLWFLCVIINFVFPHLSGDMTWLTDQVEDDRSSYLSNSFEDADVAFSSKGFRWDFVLYSSIPIILGWYTLIKNKVTNRKYTLILNLYILANSFWLFTIWIPYNNRFAYLSWFLYPILLLYPFLYNPSLRTNRAINLLILCNLAFTLLIS